jgi:hypothetical protein
VRARLFLRGSSDYSFSMAKDYMGYEALADRALRTVVRDVLQRVEKQGLIANHHFYLSFKTHDPGVEIPDFLKERYPEEMTIVLQNQYWGLKAGENHFEVTLTFQKLPAELKIPYEALTAFADPGVPFGLQFRNSTAARPKPASAPEGDKTASTLAPAPAASSVREEREQTPEAQENEPAPQVVSLDKFRKK